MDTPSINSIRILLVEDHEVIRTALRMLLDGRQGFQVVGEAANRENALAAAKQEQPDVILLDLHLGDANGLDFLRDLHRVAGEAKVIILTAERDPKVHVKAVHLGARGLVLKDKAAEVVVKAILKVNAGEIWFDPALMAKGQCNRCGFVTKQHQMNRNSAFKATCIWCGRPLKGAV